jgi:FkbM family methyltransferase
VISVRCPGAGEDGQNDVTVVTHVKLFRNLPHLRFEGKIHEQILGAIRRAHGEVVGTDLFVVHSGYDHSAEGQEKKKQRDLHLLHLELKEQPDHPFTLFNLGMTYADLGHYQEAVTFLNGSIKNSEETESHLRKVYAILVYCHSQLGNREAAWEACQSGLRLFPEDMELRFRQGILLHEAGRLGEAIEAYLRVISTREKPHFFSVDVGIQGFKTRHNLALVYQDMGDLQRAEEQWRLIVEENHKYRMGWRGLGQILVAQGKLEDAVRLKNRLQKDPHLHFEGILLESQLAAQQGDVASARRTLERAVKKYPNQLPPLQALCRLLFERADPDQAEKALRELVKRDPADAAAFHNLGIVCLRQGKHEKALRYLRNSLQLRPKSVITLLQLGNALKENGQRAEAIAIWQEILRLAPGNPDAIQALDQAKRQNWQTAGSNAQDSGPISVATRGAVDRAIVRDIWERDTYGIGHVSSPPQTVVDIGAHIGAFSVRAHRAWPNARIIACEPDPDNLQLLKQNLHGCTNVEIVAAAIVSDNVSEVDFFQVTDKVGQNSGGGGCVPREPDTVKTRVPAMSVAELWQSKNIGHCDFLKIDCEGLEVPILRALAEGGSLGGVGIIAGEWHALDDLPESVEIVQRDIRAVLANTHEVLFAPQRGGREGHFTAHPRNRR